MTKLSEFDRLLGEINALDEDIDDLHYIVTKKDPQPTSFNEFSVQMPILEKFVKCIERLARKSYYYDLKIENEVEENFLSFNGDGSEYAYLRKIDKFIEEWNSNNSHYWSNLSDIRKVYGLRSYSTTPDKSTANRRLANRIKYLDSTLWEYRSLLRIDKDLYDQIPLEKISEVVEVALFCLECCLDELSIKINQILDLVGHSLLLTQYPEKFPNLIGLGNQKTLSNQRLAKIDETEDHIESHKPILKNLPPKILLLDQIGFFKLPDVQKLSYESKGKLISALCGGSADNAVDYIRQCDPDRTSLEKNPYRNPSNVTAVSNLLKSLDGG